jgi:hypothetical protein
VNSLTLEKSLGSGEGRLRPSEDLHLPLIGIVK